MSEKKRSSVLNPALLQSITQAFSQSTPTTSTPSDQLLKLSVNTPVEITPNVSQPISIQFVLI
jgi:hypothetical protein